MQPPRAGRATSDWARAQADNLRICGRAARKSETCLFQWSGERAYLDEISALLDRPRDREWPQHRLDILWLAPADLRWLDLLLATHYFDLDEDLVELLSRVLPWGRQCQGPVQLIRRQKPGASASFSEVRRPP